ncbi:MAG: hypothetical protein FWD66_01855 [Paludibacter sp.]|nr:hypothetical protein [Paludibacter sp.]
MKSILFLLFLLVACVSFGQDIVVEKVRLTNNDNDVSEIPRVKDLKNANNVAVEKINAQILDRFMITGFEQNEKLAEELTNWFGIECSSELKDDILYIWLSGTYYGAYDNDIEDCFYFNLKTGEELQMSEIQFQSLFTLSGYLDFINKYWLKGVKKEFKEAIKCADSEPYCSYYDIDYSVDENKLSISLNDDCYPRVVRVCSPYYNLSIPLDSVKTYLNDVGKYILVESDYFSKSPIDKFIENKRLKEKIPDNVFLFGKIDDKYPISMAICIDKQNQISGYYYYDNKLQKLNLYGGKNGEDILLTEEVNGKITGFFELKISKDYNSKGFFIMANSNEENDEYLTGKWYDAEKTKQFDIKFTEAKTKNSWLWEG